MKGPTIGGLINHITEVIRQPELHTKEIPIVIGLAILLVFIILVIIAIIFVRPTSRSVQQVEEGQLKQSIRRRYIAGTIFGILAIASLGFAMSNASKPEFCAKCHEMRTAYKLSTKSTHKNVACLSCHQEPGIFGIFIEKLQLVEMVIAESDMIGDVTEGPVSNDMCLRCHKSILSTVSKKRIIKMKHKEPIEAGYECLDCHFSKNLFHVEKRRLDKFGMSRCVDCHNQKKASAECNTCHIGEGDIPTSVDRGSYPTVSLPDKIECKSCHSIKTCLSCHSLQLPHVWKWKTGGHALEAFVNKRLCWECHGQSTCQKCHTGTTPHGDGWVKEHGPSSKASLASCSNCHKIEEFCLVCHSNAVDFKLKSQVRKPKSSL